MKVISFSARIGENLYVINIWLSLCNYHKLFLCLRIDLRVRASYFSFMLTDRSPCARYCFACARARLIFEL